MFARCTSLALFVAVALLALSATSASAAPRSDQGRAIAVSAIASGGYKALPVVGARVSVRSGGGRLLGRAVSGRKGVSLVWPRQRGARTLRVTVAGGKVGGRPLDGTMMAVVHRYRWPQTVHVDSVTTLVGRYLRAHPNASLARAQKLAKRFLKLPRRYVIGPGGRGNAEFDGRRFLTAAWAAGGYDKFSRRMARKLPQPKARRSFAHDAPARIAVKWAQVAAVGGEAGSDVEEVASAVSKGAGFFDVLTKTTQVLQFVNVVKELAGVGSNQATKAEIEAIDAQLQQIEQSLSVIERGEEEIKHEAKINTYSVLAVLQDENSAAVQSAEETLHTAVLVAAEHGCAEAEEPGPACEEVRERLLAKGGWVDKLEGTLVEKPAKLNAYAEAIGGEAIPGPTATGQQGLVQVASEITTTNPGQGFYTSDQSARAAAVAAGWIISYAEALVMAPAFWSLTGVAPETVSEDVKQMAPYAAAMPAVMPTPVPVGTALEFAHGQLWAVEAAAEGAKPWSWFIENNGFEYEAAGNEWVSTSHPGQTTGAITSENTPAIPYADWLVVGTPQLESLLAAASPRGSQLAGEALMEQAGFSGWLLPKGNENVVGLELEYEVASETAIGCATLGASTCFWPIWVNDGVVGNMHFSSASHGYRQGWFETDKFLDIKWAGQKLYGYDNEGTIYGPIAPSRIPVLFFRPVGGECFYYASGAGSRPGASGCPS